MSEAPRSAPVLRVWDRLVRGLHWLLVVAVSAGWVTGFLLSGRRAEQVHDVAGYGVLGIVLTRWLWGLAGSRNARFSQFVRSPRSVLRYLREMRAAAEPRYLGHNPLGGWMVVLLLTLAGALSLSGALYTTDWLWGYEWLAQLHNLLAWALLGAVVLHLGGVIFTSLRHRENLPAAMLSGIKRLDGSEADRPTDRT